MKKKITYILSLLMIVCMLGACGSDNAEKTYGGYTTDELHTDVREPRTRVLRQLFAGAFRWPHRKTPRHGRNRRRPGGRGAVPR